MRISPILYSRTKAQDYRWLLCSSLLNKDDTALLSDIFKSYDRQAKLRAYLGRAMFFSITLSATYGIFVCRRAQRVDSHNREILALEGFVVGKEEGSQLASALPWLTEDLARLYVGQWVDIESLEHSKCVEHSAELTPELFPRGQESEEVRQLLSAVNVDSTFVVSFDEAGLKVLRQLVRYYAGNSPLAIAFGADRHVFDVLSPLSVVAFVDIQACKSSSDGGRKGITNPLVHQFIEEELSLLQRAVGNTHDIEDGGRPRGDLGSGTRDVCEVRVQLTQTGTRQFEVTFFASNVTNSIEIARSSPVTCPDFDFQGSVYDQGSALTDVFSELIANLGQEGWEVSRRKGPRYWWSLILIRHCKSSRMSGAEVAAEDVT